MRKGLAASLSLKKSNYCARDDVRKIFPRIKAIPNGTLLLPISALYEKSVGQFAELENVF